MIDFNHTDQEQLKSKNLSKETVFSQIETFKKGIPPTNLVAAATLGNGLLSFSPESQETLKSITMIIVKDYRFRELFLHLEQPLECLNFYLIF